MSGRSPQWWRHVPLAVRLIESGLRRRRRAEAFSAWFQLCWHAPDQVSEALESLNFNITVSLAGLGCEIARVIYVGLLLGLVLFVAWVALTLIAAIKASEGVNYRYPFSLRLVK